MSTDGVRVLTERIGVIGADGKLLKCSKARDSGDTMSDTGDGEAEGSGSGGGRKDDSERGAGGEDGRALKKSMALDGRARRGGWRGGGCGDDRELKASNARVH